MYQHIDIDITVYECRGYPDQKERRCFGALCDAWAEKYVRINRFSLEHDREAFFQNKDLRLLICYAGVENLPVTCVNGMIRKIEQYPTRKELRQWILTDAKRYV